MGAMIDLRCTGCSRRIGFRLGQEPKCYHCGTINDLGEVNKLIDGLKAFEAQREVHGHLGRLLSGGAFGARCAEIAEKSGVSGALIKAFVIQCEPLPAAELERMTAWLAGRA